MPFSRLQGGSGMKRSCVVLMACVLGASVFADPEQSATLTAGFTKLEIEMMEAVKLKDMPRLEQLLAPDYVLVTSARAGDPMDRKSWLDLIAVYTDGSFTIGDHAVRCLEPRGDVAETSHIVAVAWN